MASIRWLCVLTIVLCGALLSAEARAIDQPDGTPIPQTDGLQRIFSSRGESVDARRDAALVPERFVPGCRLTFTLVSRGPALFRNAFGWYNVTGRAPTEEDLHVLLPCDAAEDASVTLDLSREPAYRGGEIGFFLKTPEDGDSGRCAGGDCCARTGRAGRTYYSERRFNPDSVEAGGTGYIHLLIYDSRATRDAFYFAWEDLFRGGDNNFTDFVAMVSNIVCAGAGGSCDTGMRGACAQGVQQCRSGSLACVAVNAPSAERCDGIDNDCNGMIDDGMNLCARGEVCDRGACVAPCLEGQCFEGFRCTERGTCVEQACVGMTCAEGQRCEAGRCVGVCDGIRCPAGQVCRVGRCVDPCADVTCDSDQVCVAGTCVPKCQCRRCGADERCQSDGRCISSACAGLACPVGQVCVMGACVDACEGARCPRGETCVLGACVPQARPDAGSPMDASVPDRGAPFDAGASGDVASDARMRTFVDGSRGCACRAGASSDGDPRGASVLALTGVALAVARRRCSLARR